MPRKEGGPGQPSLRRCHWQGELGGEVSAWEVCSTRNHPLLSNPSAYIFNRRGNSIRKKEEYMHPCCLVCSFSFIFYEATVSHLQVKSEVPVCLQAQQFVLVRGRGMLAALASAGTHLALDLELSLRLCLRIFFFFCNCCCQYKKENLGINTTTYFVSAIVSCPQFLC